MLFITLANRHAVIHTGFGRIYPKSAMEKKMEHAMNKASQRFTAKRNIKIMPRSRKDFQDLIVRLATGFINVPTKDIQSAINEFLAEVGKFTKMDRAYVFEHDLAGRTTTNTFEWCDRDISRQIGNLQAVPFERIPEIISTLQKGEPFQIPKIADRAKEDPIRTHIEPQGVLSILLLPLMQGETCVGFVGFDAVRKARRFSSSDIDLLKIIAVITANILSRQKTEELLRKSEEKFHSIFQYHSAIKLLIDPDTGIISDANEAAEKFYGWPVSKLKTMQIQDINTLSPAAIRSRFEEARSNSRNYFNFCHRLADGSLKDVEVYSSKIEIDGKEYLHSIIHDVSVRKLAEVALRESRERAQAMLKAIPDMVFRLDRQGLFLDYKADESELYIRSGKTIVGKRNRDITTPEFADLIDLKIRETLQTGMLQTFEYQLRIPGKGMRNYEARMTVSGADEVTAIVRDITERKKAEEAMEFQTKRLGLILELYRFMDTSQEHLLDLVLDILIESTKSDIAFIGLMDENESAMSIHAWSKSTLAGCSVQSAPVHFPIEAAGLWGECVRQRRPIIVNAYAESSNKKGYPTGHVPIERFLSVPILDGERIVAVAAVANKLDLYDTSDSTAVILLGERLWSIIRRKNMETELLANEMELRKSRSSLRTLLAHREHIREVERTQIAHDIHDELGQNLTGLKMDLHSISRSLGNPELIFNRNAMDTRIADANALLDTIIGVVQDIAARLRPGVLDKLGLTPALHYEARLFSERTGIPCETRLPDALPPLSAETVTALFRICQECLTNITRHAFAKRVVLSLEIDGADALLRVQDDGKGIQKEDLDNPNSLGLLGMKERASMLAGTLTIKQGEKGGTEVLVRIPVEGTIFTEY